MDNPVTDKKKGKPVITVPSQDFMMNFTYSVAYEWGNNTLVRKLKALGKYSVGDRVELDVGIVNETQRYLREWICMHPYWHDRLYGEGEKSLDVYEIKNLYDDISMLAAKKVSELYDNRI